MKSSQRPLRSYHVDQTVSPLGLQMGSKFWENEGPWLAVSDKVCFYLSMPCKYHHFTSYQKNLLESPEKDTAFEVLSTRLVQRGCTTSVHSGACGDGNRQYKGGKVIMLAAVVLCFFEEWIGASHYFQLQAQRPQPASVVCIPCVHACQVTLVGSDSF